MERTVINLTTCTEGREPVRAGKSCMCAPSYLKGFGLSR